MLRAFAYIKHLFDNMRMEPKLRMFYVLVCTIPCLIIGCSAIVSTRNMIMIQRRDAVIGKHAQTQLVFSNAATTCVNVSTNLMFDSDLCTLLTQSYTGWQQARKAQLAYGGINDALKNYPQLSYITIYTENRFLADTGYFRDIDQSVKESKWYRVAAQSKGVIRWYTGELQRDSNLRLVRKLPLPNGKFAIMELGVSDSYLRLQLADVGLRTMMYLDAEQVFFASSAALQGVPPPNTEENMGKPTMMEWAGQEMLLYRCDIPIDKSISVFTMVTADPTAASTLSQTSWKLVCMLFTLLTTAFLLIVLFSYQMGSRVAVLRDQMRSIAQGSLSISQTVTGNDELGQLFSDMTKTIDVLQALTLAVYEKELSYQKLLGYQSEMEYKMLASQVNPHFLFNTLEGIRMQALINDDHEVAAIVRKLGLIMRRLLSSSDRYVLLDSELELIRSYLDIQQFRYGHKLAYDISIGEDVQLDTQRILPLTLLPLIENAVLHGLETKQNTGHIQVDIQREDDKLHIVVSDNGSGMDEEALGALLERMHTKGGDMQGKSIGLYNVYQRIKLCYGDGYGMNIHSQLGEWTRIDMLIPVT